MSVTLLGQNINVIRPAKVSKPQLPRQLWRQPRASRVRTIKRSIEELKQIAQEMGCQLSTERS
jgi:hypothetical protein